MTRSIDFYFDFISPYSYIAYKKIELLKSKNINFRYKPILLGGLHKLEGITAPAFIKSKLENMINDCTLISKKNNISFIWNSKFPINSLYLMRGYLLINDDLKNCYLKIENLIWTEIDDPRHYKRAVDEIWPLLKKKDVL